MEPAREAKCAAKRGWWPGQTKTSRSSPVSGIPSLAAATSDCRSSQDNLPVPHVQMRVLFSGVPAPACSREAAFHSLRATLLARSPTLSCVEPSSRPRHAMLPPTVSTTSTTCSSICTFSRAEESGQGKREEEGRGRGERKRGAMRKR